MVISIWLLVGFHPAARSVHSTPADNTRKRVWQYREKERTQRSAAGEAGTHNREEKKNQCMGKTLVIEQNNTIDSDSFTILGLRVLGLAVSNINESPLQTNESKM